MKEISSFPLLEDIPRKNISFNIPFSTLLILNWAEFIDILGGIWPINKLVVGFYIKFIISFTIQGNVFL